MSTQKVYWNQGEFCRQLQSVPEIFYLFQVLDREVFQLLLLQSCSDVSNTLLTVDTGILSNLTETNQQ